MSSLPKVPKPIVSPALYQNPYMAPNDFSEIHFNAYQTDTCTVKGPATSPNPTIQQAFINPPDGIAATIAFDSTGRIITIRVTSTPSDPGATELLLIDPKSLDVLAETKLPSRGKSHGLSFAGGYFYLDQQERVVCVTADQSIQIYRVISISDEAGVFPEFELVQTIELSGVLSADDVLNSVLPDSQGNLWFICQSGKVGYISQSTGTVSHIYDTNEPISKSFASDEDLGVYIVTDVALYRFKIGSAGPAVIWRMPYDVGRRKKPGQNQQGSGTTPTCFNDATGNKFVAITDNADPYVHVNIFDRKSGRLIAQQAVFKDLPHDNSCENSLIAVNNSIIVENNYGNKSPASTLGSMTTKPGINRVDFDPATGKSHVVWVNKSISIPSVVSQLSLGDGCIYTYAKSSEGWYWAALDFETGDIVAQSEYVPWSNFLGGILANNYYAGISIGPDGSAYVSVLGGIVAWRAS